MFKILTFLISFAHFQAFAADAIVSQAVHGEIISGATLRPLISEMAHMKLERKYRKGMADFQSDINRFSASLKTAMKPLHEYVGNDAGYTQLNQHLAPSIARERSTAKRLIQTSYNQLIFHHFGIEYYRPFCELAHTWLGTPIPESQCEQSLTAAIKEVHKSLNIIPDGDNFKKFR